MTLSLSTLKRPTRLRDQVFEAIRDKVRSGAVAPSERLSEQSLADQLGVSRTPIREALFQLTRDGLLEEQARGYVLPRLTPGDVAEITELRLLLEPPLIKGVAESGDSKLIDRICTIVARERRAMNDPKPRAFVAANADFRRALFDACGNRRLATYADQVNDQIQSIRMKTLQDKGNRRYVVEAHERLIETLRRGDADAAMAEIIGLIEGAGDAYISEIPGHTP